eukprot:6183673-Pleurochrysis_carterae.AAC.3
MTCASASEPVWGLFDSEGISIDGRHDCMCVVGCAARTGFPPFDVIRLSLGCVPLVSGQYMNC